MASPVRCVVEDRLVGEGQGLGFDDSRAREPAKVLSHQSNRLDVEIDLVLPWLSDKAGDPDVVDARNANLHVGWQTGLHPMHARTAVSTSTPSHQARQAPHESSRSLSSAPTAVACFAEERVTSGGKNHSRDRHSTMHFRQHEQCTARRPPSSHQILIFTSFTRSSLMTDSTQPRFETAGGDEKERNHETRNTARCHCMFLCRGAGRRRVRRRIRESRQSQRQSVRSPVWRADLRPSREAESSM